MDDLEKSKLLFPFCMLAALILSIILAEGRSLKGETLSDTSIFGLVVFGCFVPGVVFTALCWQTERRFTISTFGLILLMTFSFADITSPTLGLIFGTTLIVIDLQMRKRRQNNLKHGLYYAQRLAAVCGGLYLMGITIQFFKLHIAG